MVIAYVMGDKVTLKDFAHCSEDKENAIFIKNSFLNCKLHKKQVRQTKRLIEVIYHKKQVHGIHESAFLHQPQQLPQCCVARIYPYQHTPAKRYTRPHLFSFHCTKNTFLSYICHTQKVIYGSIQIKSAIVAILLLLTVTACTIHLFIEYCDFASVSSPL